MRKKLLRGLKPAHVWLLVMALGLACSAIALVCTRGEAWKSVTYGGGKSNFYDFFAHIFFTTNPESVYATDMNACFPPFAYIFYRFLYLILPEGCVPDTNMAHLGPYAYFVYAMYLCVLVWAFTSLTRRFFHARGAFAAGVSLLMLLSHSFTVGAVERGNSVFAVLLLLLFALILDASGKRAQREAAMVLIAFAAGLKIYPAVFGLMYVFEKRYKEAARLVVYGLIVFFAPFLRFGGLDGVMLLLKNQLSVHTQLRSAFTAPGLAAYAARALGVPGAQGALSTAAMCVFLLAALFFAWRAPRKELRLVWLVSIVTLVPRWSGLYTFVYYALPLYIFLADDARPLNLFNLAYAVAYALVFVLALAGPLSPYINYLGIYLLLLLSALETLFARRIHGKARAETDARIRE